MSSMRFFKGKTMREDTIAAISTAYGEGGIGIIRVSGDESFDVVQKIFTGKLREREMVDISILDPNEPDGSFVDFSENIEYRFYDDIERRLKDLGCTGTPPNTSVRFRVLFTKFHENRKNAFLDWIKSLIWDGVCRVDTWFQRFTGHTEY